MTNQDYMQLLKELVGEVTEAETKFRKAAQIAPVTSAREETLGAADELSSVKRRLRSTIARQEEHAAELSAVEVRPEPVRDPVLIGDLSIDPISRKVSVKGKVVELANKEYTLLLYLAGDPLRVFTKQELLQHVWGFKSEGKTRTLDSHASRLRRKLAVESDAEFVVNCWGVGYRLVAHEPVSTIPMPVAA